MTYQLSSFVDAELHVVASTAEISHDQLAVAFPGQVGECQTTKFVKVWEIRVNGEISTIVNLQ